MDERKACSRMPALGDLQTAFRGTWKLRLALNILEREMPQNMWIMEIRHGLIVFRRRIELMELDETRCLGPVEYLLINPLTPGTDGESAEDVAAHVRALDDLGLILRLD